jgi:hypothetical protein
MRALDVSGRRFRREQARFAPRGSDAYQAILGVLRALCAAGPRDLPGPEDVAVELPMSVMGRPVPGTDLVVAYVAGPDVLHVVALIRRR